MGTKSVNHGNVFGTGNWYTFYCENCGQQVYKETSKCEKCGELLKESKSSTGRRAPGLGLAQSAYANAENFASGLEQTP